MNEFNKTGSIPGPKLIGQLLKVTSSVTQQIKAAMIANRRLSDDASAMNLKDRDDLANVSDRTVNRVRHQNDHKVFVGSCAKVESVQRDSS
jgi:hypothetical protein